MPIPPSDGVGMTPERRQRLRCILWSMRASGEGHYNISRLLLKVAKGDADGPPQHKLQSRCPSLDA